MDAAVRRRMVERFRLTLDLFEFGAAMLRQRLRRTHPTASEAEIDAMVTEWLHRRPGAEGGDCPGRVRSWPRR
ncbi:hypothetical protein L6Q96_12930 [Candidatus Binatia bacterium]|nr:hypothetical protein [Candidatus Binatia bacterium]